MADDLIERRVEPGLGLYVEVDRRGPTVVIVSCAHCHTRFAVGTDLQRSVKLASLSRAIRPCCNAVQP